MKEFKRLQREKSRVEYTNRVNGNQDKINEMSEKIVELVRQESELIDKIKNTTQIKDNINMRLNNEKMIQKVPIKERILK
jgi:hypothetical protein